MEKNKTVRKPSRFWARVPAFIAGPFIKAKYNLHCDRKEIKGLKPPFILIANHGADIDPLFVQITSSPYLINFVGGYAYFKNKFLNWYFNKLGTIPKFQYQTDLNSMRDMLSVTKRGGVLGIFPTGRLPSCGEGFMVPDSLAKLIKISKVPVVVCKIDGAYLSKPKWAVNKKRRGRIDMKYSILLSGEDVKNMSVEEMSKIVNDALYFNDYKWNEDKHIKFGKKDLALGLETTLYRCPKCGNEFKMSSSGNVIKCDCCDFNLELTPTGEFKENEFFKNPFEFYEYQRNSIKELIANPDFKIEEECSVHVTDIHKIDDHQGNGKISLNCNEFYFEGIINDEEIQIHFPIANQFSLPYKAGENFEIADGSKIYKFFPKTKSIGTKFCLIVEELYKKSNS